MTRAVRAICGVLALVLVAGLAPPGQADGRLSREEADSLARKILDIRQYAQAPLNGARLTPVSEAEVNAYLQFELAGDLPTGVAEPAVTLLGSGRVTGRAIVDLDAVQRSRGETSWFDPTRWLTGRLPVTASGVVTTENGWARLDLQTTEVGGVPIPKMLLQEIVTYYTRSSQWPSGLDLDAPFELPARIREIHVNPRQAVVVQR